MDVRIGVLHTPKELEIELPEGANPDEVVKEIETAIAGEGVVWLTDRRGRKVGIPAAKVAYIEVGSPSDDRRVGFGAH